MSAWGNLAFPEDDTIGKEEMIELIKFMALSQQMVDF